VVLCTVLYTVAVTIEAEAGMTSMVSTEAKSQAPLMYARYVYV